MLEHAWMGGCSLYRHPYGSDVQQHPTSSSTTRCGGGAQPKHGHPSSTPTLQTLPSCFVAASLRRCASPQFLVLCWWTWGLTRSEWGRFLALGCRLLAWSRPIAGASPSAKSRLCGGRCLPLFCAHGRFPSAAIRDRREDRPCQL
jgi:hypothetical protein